MPVLLLKERLLQKYRTLDWPKQQPWLSARFHGRPRLLDVECKSCRACYEACPTGALKPNSRQPGRTPLLDMGLCLFCGQCAVACPLHAINFTNDYHLAACTRDELIIKPGQSEKDAAKALCPSVPARLFRKSFKLRQVSAGGCNACEADCNVLGTLVYDLGRFGVEFTASPRHADAIVLTGPISRNMLAALLAAWDSTPDPRVLVAVGACAISGGLFAENPDCVGGIDGCQRSGIGSDDNVSLQANIFIPGCPPNPWTILEGILMARNSR